MGPGGADPPLVTATSDRGDVVLGWLTRLTATLGVVGLLGFDGLSLVVARVQADDHATTAATAAVSDWSSHKDVQSAYDAALQALEADGDTGDTIDPASFRATPDGVVTLTLHHHAGTLLVQHLGPLRSWTTASATASAGSVH